MVSWALHVTEREISIARFRAEPLKRSEFAGQRVLTRLTMAERAGLADQLIREHPMGTPLSHRSSWRRPRIRFSSVLMVFVLLGRRLTRFGIVGRARVRRKRRGGGDRAGRRNAGTNGSGVMELPSMAGPSPRWLVSLIGVDYFGPVVGYPRTGRRRRGTVLYKRNWSHSGNWSRTVARIRHRPGRGRGMRLQLRSL